MSVLPDTWYAATAPSSVPRSALAGRETADVCIVGAGFTGVSAALHLAERGYSVIVLEAARTGWGASGRNGGQVGSGMRESMSELERSVGPERAGVLWALCEEAKAIIADRIARHGIECDWRPGNLLASTRKRYMSEIESEAEFCHRRFGYCGYRMLSRAQMREEVASECYVGGRMDAGGGHLHPLRFVLGMAEVAERAGARIFEGSRVERIRWGSLSRVSTAQGAVEAKYVILAGNAYLDRLEPRIASRMMPFVILELATEPLGEARARALIPGGACVHSTQFVVDYYRCTVADHRLLFGGGETYSDRPLDDPKAFVRRYMLRVFPQLADVRIDHAWSGRLAITMSRLPHVGRLAPNGFFAHGFSGHGVALTQIAGKLVAEAVAGTAERFDVLAGLRHRAFPGGPRFRHPLLVLGMLYYMLRDRL
ncbi:MAG: FAD-binding oxidoreductase [Thiotrichales bacterium]|nr:FAD-binding oxidoreductase [Thiotrichales bacterium]